MIFIIGNYKQVPFNNMDIKIRDRSLEEINMRKNEFLKICNVLDSLKIFYFLQTGVLLGAVREKNFIRWDWDVEISVFSSDLFPKIEQVIKKLESDLFQITKVVKKKEDCKIDFIGAYPKEVTNYTIFSWNFSKSKNIYWRRDRTVPSEFLNDFSKIQFFGREFNCPKNPEKYLTFAYGDWKTPLRTSDKELYMTKDFRNSNKVFMLNLRQNFLKFFYTLWKFIKK